MTMAVSGFVLQKKAQADGSGTLRCTFKIHAPSANWTFGLLSRSASPASGTLDSFRVHGYSRRTERLREGNSRAVPSVGLNRSLV